MQQDRLRRGLATSAVGALTITGLAVTAGPARAADGDGARLVSQANGKASLRADGSFPPSATTDLVAERLDADATLQFEVNPDPDAGDASPGWTPVDGPNSVDQRFYTRKWDGTLDGKSLAGSSVALRVAATSGGETTYSTRNDVAVTGQDSDVHSVHISRVGRGYFVQPYADSGRTGTMVAVAGTTSATSGNVQLAWWRSSDGTFQGATNAAVSPTDIKVPGAPGSETIPGGEFSAALDITGYDAAASDSALAVRAQRGTDNIAWADGPYQQEITSFRIDLDDPTLKGTPVSVQVLDDPGHVMAGVEVRRLSDGSLVGYTDGDGVTVLQENETTETYYVNTTDVDAFEEGVDIAVEVQTPAHAPVASGTEVVLADGAVFDDDEYREGDVALQVVDQDGKPLRQAGVHVYYALHRAGTERPELTPATTDQAGRVVVPFDPRGRDGTYRLAYTVAGPEPVERATTFVAGDARLRLTPARGTAPSGGKITYVGRLVVGRLPLPGRRIALSYLRGTEQAPGRKADAGIGPRRTKAGKARTRGDGTFKVTVVDRREGGRPSETGVLRAVAAAADEKASARARFVRKRRRG